MRTVVAWLVAAVCGLAWLAPVMAVPPDDVAAYCRAVYPQMQFQVRCLNVEQGAAERVSRAAAGADRDSFNRCLALSASWASMESCLTQVARSGPVGGVGGVVSPLVPGTESAASRPEDGARPSSETAIRGPAAGPEPEVAGGPAGTTTALGPSPGQTAASVEPDRPTRPISEADAERQLRGLLERIGYPAAHCTKKQYGPGWVIICE